MLRGVGRPCQRTAKAAVDDEHGHAQLRDRARRLLGDEVGDGDVLGHFVGVGERGVDLGRGLQHRGKQLAGDIELRPVDDAAGSVQADNDWIGLGAGHDLQQRVQERQSSLPERDRHDGIEAAVDGERGGAELR